MLHLTFSCIDILQYQFRKRIIKRTVTKINPLLPYNKQHYRTNCVLYKSYLDTLYRYGKTAKLQAKNSVTVQGRGDRESLKNQLLF